MMADTISARGVPPTALHGQSAMNDCAICYVTDLNFVLPALISAMGMRRFVPASKAHIYIFVVDNDSHRIEKVAEFGNSHGIRIVSLDERLFAGIDWSRTHTTHVPMATLGRFFIDEFLPSSCERIIYLDGDTWIRRDPSALIDYRVPDGCLAAVEDISFFCYHDMTRYGRFVRAYFSGLGVQPGRGYFNAGVFAVSRSAWRDIARESLAFFAANIEACKYHDQSAMNAVIGHRRIRLSPAWNFQTPYRQLGIEADIDPAIYHFNQGPKPWNGPVEPWMDLFPLYDAKINALSSLNLPSKRLSDGEVVTLNAAIQKYQRRTKLLFPLRQPLRRRRLRQFAATDSLAHTP